MGTRQQPRKPAGTPVGGQFAPTAHDEADIDLGPPQKSPKREGEGSSDTLAGLCTDEDALATIGDNSLDRAGRFRLLSERPELVCHRSPKVRAAIAEWGENDVPADHWRELANDNDPRVRAAVVAHATSSIWVYGGVHDRDQDVRSAAAESQLASTAWLVRLGEDPDPVVAAKARATLQGPKRQTVQ
jgi:hypothetical protein